MAGKPNKCLACGSDKVARIAFGFPSEKMLEQIERGETVLGGCCVTEDDPKWHCRECEHRW